MSNSLPHESESGRPIEDSINASIDAIDSLGSSRGYTEGYVDSNPKQSKSIFSDVPKRYKLAYHQFEVMFPFVEKYDKQISSFGSFDKTEVIIEFSAYQEFVLDNFEHQFNNVIFGNNKLFDYASSLGAITNPLRMHIENMVAKHTKVSLADINSSLPEGFKTIIKRTLVERKRALTNLWESFLLNIAILNYKSVILCGEYAKNKLPNNSKQVIPIKFIPKLGSEFDSLMKTNTYSLTDIKNKIEDGTLVTPYGTNVFISSLPSSMITDILDMNLEGEQLYIPTVADSYGYTEKRYEDAEHIIRTRATTSEEDLEACEDYLNEMLDYISSLGALYSELKFMNQDGNCIVVDFDFINDYKFQ